MINRIRFIFYANYFQLFMRNVLTSVNMLAEETTLSP